VRELVFPHDLILEGQEFQFLTQQVSVTELSFVEELDSLREVNPVGREFQFPTQQASITASVRAAIEIPERYRL